MRYVGEGVETGNCYTQLEDEVVQLLQKTI